jgi:hypothetical protein
METKIVGALVGAVAGAVLLAWGSLSAQALPAAAVQAENGGMITLVEGDCGRGRWRGPEGHCHWDRERIEVVPRVIVEEPRIVPRVVIEEPRVCPFGTHWWPRRRECVLN